MTLGRGRPALTLVSRSVPAPPVGARGLLGHWARDDGVDPSLVRALAWMESDDEPALVSLRRPRRDAGSAEHEHMLNE